MLFGRTARYMRGAMDRDLAAPSRANDALHLAAIEQACAAGCTRYHFGETGTSESLARFKERFGGVPVDHASTASSGTRSRPWTGPHARR